MAGFPECYIAASPPIILRGVNINHCATLRQARYRDAAHTAGLQLDTAERTNRPSLSAEATGGLHNGTLPSLYDNKGYIVAGLSVSVPILDGRRADDEQTEARASLRGAQARIQVEARVITTEVQNSLEDLAAAQARLGSADTLVAQAEEALALAQTRYTNGVITNFELLDAQSAARAAELTRLQARYDCTLARQAIARAAGQPPQA